MSRRKSSEPGFNSDSFLDIVCNLVGIMIILIVVAGLRVSRAPVVRVESEPAPEAPVGVEPQDEPEPKVAAIKTTELSDWLELAPGAPTDPPESVPAAPPVAAPPVEAPPADLISQAEELRRQVAQYAERMAELKQREDAARLSRSAADQKMRRLTDDLNTAKSEAQAAHKQVAEADGALKQLESQAARISTALAEASGQTAVPQVLKHAVTPISRQVSTKDELNFRLSENRVSVVPLESLAEALKLRMERSREMFLRVNRYEGVAGPADGYLMRYVIEKQKPSVIEELRNGGPFFRIQLSYYELEAGPDVVSESAEEALRPGSRFLNALARARPGTSLTFWVYPESFDLHRALQEYAHEAGFDVAARPLPVGVPIAGSPNGSRSVAQ